MMNSSGVNVLVCRTEEFLRNKSDVSSEMLLRYLQELYAHENTIPFKNVLEDSNKLYVCLHQLISKLEPSSNILWAAVRVFEKCCSKVKVYSSLIPCENFIAPITELLLTNLSHDKKLCVLKILLELTKEIKVLEKESSLQCLTSKLIQFIMTGETEVVRLSLIILVNICHDNYSIVYCLKSCIGGNFFRALMNLHDQSITTRMQMCKLLFLLEPISLTVDGPPDVSRTIIDLTFSNLIEAYGKRETLLLHDIMEFFKELSCLPTYVDLLRSYNRWPDFCQDVLHLIQMCDSENGYIVFDFMYSLLSVKVPALVLLYPQIVELCLQRLANLENEKICSKIVRVLRVIVLDVEKGTSVYNSMIQLLDLYLPNILQLYHCTELPANEVCLVTVLQLLYELLKFDELRAKIIRGVNIQRIEEIFSIFDVLSTHYIEPQDYQNHIMLCVSALTFLSSLSQYDKSYCKVRDTFFFSSEILKILAAGLYDNQARMQVLTLISTKQLPEESVSTIAKILSGNHSSLSPTEENAKKFSMPRSLLESSFNLRKGCQFDELLEATKQILDNRELKNITVSAVMSLYEYKVSAASHTEQNLYSCLEIARNHSAEMQQKLLDIEARVQQMRELLLKNQQCAEYLSVELVELRHIREVDRVTSRKNMKKYKEELLTKEKLLQNTRLEHECLKDKTKELNELKKNLENNLAVVQEELASTSSIANKHSVQLHVLEESRKETDSLYSGLRERSEFLDDSLRRRKEVLAEREAEAASLKKQNSNLEKNVANLRMLGTAQKKTVQEKDQEILTLKGQLSDLQHTRDLIAQISGGKKK